MPFFYLAVFNEWIVVNRLFRSIGGADTVETPMRVRTVKSLAMDDLFFVDVGMWQETLGGMEAVVLVPLLCTVLYGFEVPVTA